MVLDRMGSRLVRHGEFPRKLLGAALLLRGVDLLLVQSTFVPDEYWQSLEVAHRRVFGYGRLTWEWERGLRSYLYVSLVSCLYGALALARLDSPLALVWLPRLFQAALSALADVYFVRWVHEKRYRQHSWAFISWVTCFFVSYCSTRTLINTVEMNLATVALYYYPWSPKRNNLTFVTIVAFMFFMRPTSAVMWVPMVFFNVLSVQNRLKYVLTTYVPVGISVSALCVGIDYYFYGRLVFTPWEFFYYNVLKNVGEFYGVHNFFWYFYAGIPAVLGIQFVPFYYNCAKILTAFTRVKKKLKYDAEYQVAVSVVWSVLAYSFVPHKEFRFLLPLVPMMLYISSNVWSRWSVRADIRHIYLAAFVLIVSNFCALLFLGQFHQAGGLRAMRYLSGEAAEGNATSRFLFLTPCHSLPLYSHLHVDVPVRFLTCEPNFTGDPSYSDEADQFFNNSMAWMKKEYSGKHPCMLPTHIVAYSSLNITNFLYMNKYNVSAVFFDSYIYDERRGESIIVHKKSRPVSCP